MPDIDELGRKLLSDDAEERREAAVDLGAAGRAAVPLLFKALEDKDWRVRKTAVEALVGIAGEEVVSGLIHALKAHDNAGARNSAIEALVQLGGASIGALLPALETPDPDVRKFIVDILGDIKDARAVPALVQKLTDDDENIRVAAAEALGKIRDPLAVDALLACLGRNDQGWLDYAAAEALGEIGDERALGPLLAALSRSSLREPVLEALGKIGNAATLGPLIAGLDDPLRIIREVSIVALSAIFRKSAAPERLSLIAAARSGVSVRAMDFLEEILMTSTGELQRSVISLLGWIGKKRSVEKLLSILNDEELEDVVAQSLKFMDKGASDALLPALSNENALVRRTIAQVFAEVGNPKAEAPLIELLSDENGHVRSTAAAALGRIRSKKAIPALLDLLSDEYESVQEEAIRALAAIGDESVLDGLIADFSSRDAFFRRNIALLLGTFTAEKAVDALAFALKDEEPAVRKAVVQALGNASGMTALKSLLLAITDDDPEVRMLAAEALGKKDAPEAAEALFPLLEDDDLWVRAAAARGLGRTGGEKAADVLASYLGSATDIFLLALIDVLGTLKSKQALVPLAGLAEHPDPEVRKTVLAALAGYEGEVVQRAVMARLSDPHWSVRKASVEVIKQMHISAAEPLLEQVAEHDEDAAVRRAAKEALGR
jgi:HEAT repeat protein